MAPSGQDYDNQEIATPDDWFQLLKWNDEAKRQMKRYKVEVLTDIFACKRQRVYDTNGNMLRVCRPRDCSATIGVGGSLVLTTATLCRTCWHVTLPFARKEMLAELFEWIDRTPNLDWILTTGYPFNILIDWPVLFPVSAPGKLFTPTRPNVHLGVWSTTPINGPSQASAARIKAVRQNSDLCAAVFSSPKDRNGDITEWPEVKPNVSDRRRIARLLAWSECNATGRALT
jgi:hypothetical protein